MAGLGQAVVSNPRVPERIRHALDVESGLNDGISLPFVLILFGLAEAEAGATGAVATFLREIGVAAGLGVVAGALAAVVLVWAKDALAQGSGNVVDQVKVSPWGTDVSLGETLAAG